MQLHDSLPDFLVTPISPTTSRNISIGFQSLLALNIKFCLLFLRSKMGVAPKYLRDAIRLPTSTTSLRPLRSMDTVTGGSFLSLGLGQPWWPCLNLLPLLPLLFGIAFHLQLVLLSYHPIFL